MSLHTAPYSLKKLNYNCGATRVPKLVSCLFLAPLERNIPTTIPRHHHRSAPSLKPMALFDLGAELRPGLHSEGPLLASRRRYSAFRTLFVRLDPVVPGYNHLELSHRFSTSKVLPFACGIRNLDQFIGCPITINPPVIAHNPRSAASTTVFGVVVRTLSHLTMGDFATMTRNGPHNQGQAIDQEV